MHVLEPSACFFVFFCFFEREESMGYGAHVFERAFARFFVCVFFSGVTGVVGVPEHSVCVCHEHTHTHKHTQAHTHTPLRYVIHRDKKKSG